MTDEELDRARLNEAFRRYGVANGASRTFPDYEAAALIAARLAREGWAPPDPLLLEARGVLKQFKPELDRRDIDRGEWDRSDQIAFIIAALRRGIEIGRGG